MTPVPDVFLPDGLSQQRTQGNSGASHTGLAEMNLWVYCYASSVVSLLNLTVQFSQRPNPIPRT